MYCFRRGVLGPALRRLTPDNPDAEFRLPDVVAVLHKAGYRVGAITVGDDSELAEVDDRLHLAEVEAELRRRINHRWLASGVTMVDPATTYVAGNLLTWPGGLDQPGDQAGEGGRAFGQLAHLLAQFRGPSYSPAHETRKKSELVQVLAQLFADAAEDKLEDKKLAERLNRWLPSNLREEASTDGK